MSRTFLVSVADWRATAFLRRPPSRRTVVRWLESGELPGRKIGGTWYVLVDEHGMVAFQPSLTGHAGADRLLSDWRASA